MVPYNLCSGKMGLAGFAKEEGEGEREMLASEDNFLLS